MAIAAAANAAAIALTGVYEDLHPGKKPQSAPDAPPKAAPQGGDTKSPDPVVTDGGHDYAGLARPHYGPVGLTANFGVGCMLRTVPLSMDLNTQRSTVAKEVQKKLTQSRTRRRRPKHETRSWTAVKRKLEDRFNAAAGDIDDFVRDFHRDYERHRQAARVVGNIMNAIEGGNMHIDL